MQSLRVVGPGDDGEFVVLESLDGAERFSLPLDERLRDVSSYEPSRSAPAQPDPNSELTPRDIQTRVRAGESAQAVADDAGVPLDRVMRFAFPVLAERSRVVDEARRARARRGADSHPVDFGELIDQRLGEHAVNPASVGWDAFRREDGGWTVVAAFAAAEQNRLAKFSFALHTRTVSALDALAADLLSDRPVRALLPQQPDPVGAAADGDAPPVRLSAVPDQPAGPALSDEARDEASRPASSAVRPGRRQKAHTRPIPVGADDELFDQEAVEPSPARDTGPTWHEPPLPFEPGAPDSAAPEDQEDAKHKRRRGEKPRMPSWDDILLGVRHKND